MISLTYLSTAVRVLDQPDLEALLRTSRDRNTAAEVTGMLLYADGHFIQTLEGAQPAVEEVFARIEVDPRHRDIVVTLKDTVEARAFPGWTMGFRSLAPEQTAAIPGFSDYLDPHSDVYRDNARLGRAGIFHRVFRDTLPRGT